MFAGEVDLDNWYKPNIDKRSLKEFSTPFLLKMKLSRLHWLITTREAVPSLLNVIERS